MHSVAICFLKFFFRLLCVSFVFFRFFSPEGKKKETKKKQITTECLHIRVFKFSNECNFPMNMQSTLSQFVSLYMFFFFVLSFLSFCVVFSKEKCRFGIPESPDLRKKENTYKAPWCNLLLFCFFILYFCLFFVGFLFSFWFPIKLSILRLNFADGRSSRLVKHNYWANSNMF